MSNPFATGRYGGGGGNQSPAQPQPVGDLASQIVNTVKQDMESVEKSGQWIFSCYSPAKDCVSVPGMDDISPEELRLEAYVAKTSGSIDQYSVRIKTLISDFSNKRNQMRNPDPNMRQTLVKIYNKENISGGIGGGGGGVFGAPAQPSGGMFGGSTSSSSGGIFGGSQPGDGGGGLFGKSTATPTPGGMFSSSQSSTFGTSSTVGQNAQAGSSLFGGASTQTSQGSIFGGASSTGIFGGAAAQPGASAFGGTSSLAPSTGGSVFGGSSVFGSTPSQTAFGAPAAATGGSIFGAATPSAAAAFGAPAAAITTPQNTGVFGAAAAATGSSIFGSSSQAPAAFASPQPSGASLFGGSTTSTVVDTTQPSGQALFGGGGLFGAAAQTGSGGLFGSSGGGSQGGGGLFGKPGGSGGLFGQVEKQMDPSCIYTPMELLTEVEKAAFLAPEFELGNVPTRPPPRELCF